MVNKITMIPVINNSNEEIIPQDVEILNVEENIPLKKLLLNLKMIQQEKQMKLIQMKN